MPVQTSCPSCGQKLRVPDELVGQSVKCPKCSFIFVASLEEQPAGPPPRETASESSSERYQRIPEQQQPVASSQRGLGDVDDRSTRPRLEPHRGTLILTLGILGIIGIGAPITGIIAWILGSSDLGKIKAGIMDPEGEGQTRAGWILGIVSSIMWLLAFGGCCCFYAFVFMAAAANSP